MTTNNTSVRCPYGFGRVLAHTTVEAAADRVTAALKEQGFGVLTQIDVKDTLKKKLDVEFRRYLILGACNPVLAHKALAGDPQIGLLLPCNVVIQESADSPGDAVVTIADPEAMFRLVNDPKVEPIAAEADQRLRRVIASLG